MNDLPGLIFLGRRETTTGINDPQLTYCTCTVFHPSNASYLNEQQSMMSWKLTTERENFDRQTKEEKQEVQKKNNI